MPLATKGQGHCQGGFIYTPCNPVSKHHRRVSGVGTGRPPSRAGGWALVARWGWERSQVKQGGEPGARVAQRRPKGRALDEKRGKLGRWWRPTLMLG